MERLQNHLRQIVRGQEKVIEDVLLALLAGGHVLLEGVPGIGKTLLAKTLASSLSMQFSRLQFTPDMLPSDVTGSVLYDMREGNFRVEQGPIFAHVILADEVNRTPPKTQAALLEAMEERQVTLYGQTLALPKPFFVIATQNPLEYEGTYPLPEAQLDRFLVKVHMGYPSLEEECALLTEYTPHTRKHTGTNGEGVPPSVSQAAPVLSIADILSLQSDVAEIEVAPTVIRYIAEITARTRTLPSLRIGASPRAGTALLMAGRASAYLAGRHFVTPDDITRVLRPVLSHRLLITPSAELEGVTADDILAELVHLVAVPR